MPSLQSGPQVAEGKKEPESLMRPRIASRERVKEMRPGSSPLLLAAWLISVRIAW